MGKRFWGVFSIIAIQILTAAGAKAAPPRILFVAPHPDDEMLATGGQIYAATHAIKSGLDYRIVLMTCGDGFTAAFDWWKKSHRARDLNGDGKIDYLDLGYARRLESLAALQRLGVPPEKVIFLGYPDGGLAHLMMSGGPVYRSPLTKAEAVPYPFAYHFNSPFTGDAVLRDLKSVIAAFNPTLVYSPTPTDEHPDHAQTREFVSMALQASGSRAEHVEYLVHWESHDELWPHPTQNWATPVGHIAPDYTISLKTDGWTPLEKVHAIRTYTTQVAVDYEYLVNFAKSGEMFWKTREKKSDYLSLKPR